MLPQMILPRYRWRYPDRLVPDAAYVSTVAGHGGSARLARVLARRGVATSELEGFFGPARAALHDPALLPDAAVVVSRLARARETGERVLVFGDFDADGLTGLAVLVRALRRLGIDTAPHVPRRLDDGHGLSMRAVEQARAAGRTLVITVDTGSSSVAEVAAAREAGIDVIVTDHHQVPPVRPEAVALVNPQRPDAGYPERRLAGSGVALKVAALLLSDLAGGSTDEVTAEFADLAAIGTVADVAPILGENRAIARLGLERLRTAPRAGLAALLARAATNPAEATLETVAFAIAPRLNAAGRIGEADDAAALLLTDDPAEAEELATRLETANGTRRDVTRTALEEARAALLGAHAPTGAAVIVRGTWPVGVLGLVAGRLAEEHARPAVVATQVGDLFRASCRAPAGHDLASALEACADLLVRHGGHRGAAGFEVEPANWDAFTARFCERLQAAVPGDPVRELTLDLALSGRSIDYALLRDLAALEPTGPGNPQPVIAVHDLTVTRVRAATGGHAQLTLRREVDVLDGIAFERADLAVTVQPGDLVDVAARLVSRRFGGYESLQLEIIDVATARSLARPLDVAANAGPPAAVAP